MIGIAIERSNFLGLIVGKTSKAGRTASAITSAWTSASSRSPGTTMTLERGTTGCSTPLRTMFLSEERQGNCGDETLPPRVRGWPPSRGASPSGSPQGRVCPRPLAVSPMAGSTRHCRQDSPLRLQPSVTGVPTLTPRAPRHWRPLTRTYSTETGHTHLPFRPRPLRYPQFRRANG